jgi:hypothetical protein
VSGIHGAFDPETIKVLSAAFEEACLALPSGQQTAAMRSALAERILRKAAEGERDPINLRAYALLQTTSTPAGAESLKDPAHGMRVFGF